MNRKPLIFSILCILIITAISAHAWFTLPELEKYPLHWNAAGEADGFGDKNAVLMTLAIFPAIVTLMTVMFYVMPKVEPLRKNLEQSRSAYNFVWMLMSAFLVGVGALVAFAIGSEQAAKLGASPRLVVVALSLLFIGIGNVMGKVRQNFMFGIRTPWTLSSELSWEKTHRIGGRAFVAGGLISIAAAILAPASSFKVFNLSIFSIVAIVLIYSYMVWKTDPDKRT